MNSRPNGRPFGSYPKGCGVIHVSCERLFDSPSQYTSISFENPGHHLYEWGIAAPARCPGNFLVRQQLLRAAN